jgi:DnaJ-class molecular chaperone
MFELVKKAHEFLINEEKRAQYDAKIRNREERKRKYAAETATMQQMRDSKLLSCYILWQPTQIMTDCLRCVCRFGAS